MGCRKIYGLPKNIWVAEKYMGCRKIYGLPNSDSANAVRHTFFKELLSFWQIGICQPIKGLVFPYFVSGLLFHPELCSPNGRTASCRFMVDGDNKVPVFFAGLKTVFNMCRSYGTFL